MQSVRLRRLVLAAGAAALLLTGTTAPAGAQALAGLSQSDRANGRQAYDQILAEFGGKVDGPLADYVRQVGLRVALVSVPGSAPQDWTITVLNSPVPNAMATPGGYLYITRGLLAMISTEAELASVLGHEAGHVAARHSDKRNTRAGLAGLGTVLAGVFLGSQAAQLGQVVGSAWVSGYSRAQENDADERGLRYSAAAGYDPRAAATMP
jgi:predicted Zn-dependent protease